MPIAQGTKVMSSGHRFVDGNANRIRKRQLKENRKLLLQLVIVVSFLTKYLFSHKTRVHKLCIFHNQVSMAAFFIIAYLHWPKPLWFCYTWTKSLDVLGFQLPECLIRFKHSCQFSGFCHAWASWLESFSLTQSKS